MGTELYVTTKRNFDGRHAAGGGLASADEATTGVYRTPLRNIVLAAVLAGSAVLGCSDFSGPAGGGLMWSRRVPIAVVFASLLVVRALRRAVIVSPFGIEARRTLITWRVPWAAVESFAVGDSPSRTLPHGPLTVILIDGQTRRRACRIGSPPPAGLRCGRRGRQRHPQVRPRGFLDPNWPLLLSILGGIALMVACAISDTGRMNHRLLQAGEVSYTAEELHELELEIAIAGAAAVTLYVSLVATGIAAAIWSRRSRGTAPAGPWPATLTFPEDDAGSPPMPPPAANGDGPLASLPPPIPGPSGRLPVDMPRLVICRDDGVFTPERARLAAISHRHIAWSAIEAYTFWSARGIAAFSVQIQPPRDVPDAGGGLSEGARWALTSWVSPLLAHAEVTLGGAGLILCSADTADSWLIADGRPAKGDRYKVIDEHHRIVATLQRSWPGWECEMSPELPSITRLLLCVASLWAERRHASLHSSD